MKKNKYLIFLIFLASCNPGNSKKEKGIAMNEEFVKQFEDEVRKDSLTQKIIVHGDTKAYQELFRTYTFSGHEHEWLYYAFVMANNFDYPEAYFDLYILLRTDSGSELKTDKLANYYLLKAYEKGVEGTTSEIEGRSLNKSRSIPKSNDYLREIE
jgi:hypothetical protein